MRVLLSNKFYYPRGGDCIYTLNLEELLINKGHDVAIFSMEYPENKQSKHSGYFPSEAVFSLSNKKGLVESLLRPFGTNLVKTKFNSILDDFKPDVVHLNNIHTYLSPILAKIAHQRGIRVVWTLHDYKLLCPRYDCMRDGKSCELCFENKKNVFKYTCMKNSKIASFIGYLESVYWSRKKLERFTDKFICPSVYLKNKMIQGHFSENKIVALCNFVDVEKTTKENFDKENYYCYMGRLSHEKGIESLLKAASKLTYKLKVIGDGPIGDYLRANYINSNIEFLGYKQWPEIKDILGKARFAVLPSECFENNPLSIIEAQCLGTPVVGANIGGIPELIQEGINGVLFNSGDIEDLKSKIEYCWTELEGKFDYKNIAKEARYNYSSEKYYKEIIAIYER